MAPNISSSNPPFTPASHELGLLKSLDRHCKAKDQSNAQAVLNVHMYRSEHCRNEIYRHVWICSGQPGGDPQFGEHHALEDLNRLRKAVHSYAEEVFHSLKKNERHLVEGKVWENAGRPLKKDPKWGKHHAVNKTKVLLRSLSDWRHADDQELGPLKEEQGFMDVANPLLATGALSYLEFARLSMVCKTFRDAIAKLPRGFWINAFQSEGIPLVESAEGEVRNSRADFTALAPITLSGRVISEFLGQPVGPIPNIREDVFARLSEQDPFGLDTIRKNYVLVMVPSLIQRIAGEAFPFALDPNGNLVPAPAEAVEGQVLNIPFSLKNLRILCKHPLKGRGNKPVFNRGSNAQVFEQCGLASNTTRVYLMRKQVADQSRNMRYEEQEKLVAGHRFEAMPLLLRALFDAVEILANGSCYDAQRSYARTSDRINNDVYQSVIGGFVPRAGGGFVPGGLWCASYLDSNYIGVVPGVPAGVQPAIGHWPLNTRPLESGH